MWQTEENKLYTKIVCNDFKQALQLINGIGKLAEEQNHHPTIKNTYNIVELWLSTHDAGDTVTDKDTKLADSIDNLVNELGLRTNPENSQNA
jgi:4a-hydroxytetrahydrobiopterin dehydratase